MTDKYQVELTPEIIKEALIHAEKAHAKFEAQLDKKDKNWQQFYADYMWGWLYPYD